MVKDQELLEKSKSNPYKMRGFLQSEVKDNSILKIGTEEEEYLQCLDDMIDKL